MKRRLLPFAPHSLLVAAVLPLALGAGCSSEVDPDAAAAPSQPVASLDIGGQSDPSVGISVRVRNGERERHVNLRPLAEKTAREGYVPPYFPAGRNAPKAGVPAVPAQRATAALTGAHVLDAGEAVIDGSAWLAVVAAGAECGLGDPEAEDVFSARQRAIVPAWRPDPAGGNAFTLFQSPPATCSEAAWQEQMLLCVADKLVALTDAVGSTEWAAPGRMEPEDGIPQGTWTIDAPKEDGKVILRELALTLLASLAVTDMTVPTESRGAATCSQLLGQASQDPAFAEANAHVLFGASPGEIPPYLPPRIEVSGANARALATARLTTTAHTLRAAGRLLRTTVADALEADASYASTLSKRDPLVLTRRDPPGDHDRAHDLLARVGTTPPAARRPAPPTAARPGRERGTRSTGPRRRSP